MRWLPWLVVVMVLSRHQLVDVAAAAFDDTDRARRALFYALGGLDLAIAYALVWFLAPVKSAALRIGTALACLWGIVEEAQVFVCRIAAGIDRPVQAPMWRGICDSASFPMSTLTLMLPVGIVYWLTTREGHKHG